MLQQQQQIFQSPGPRHMQSGSSRTYHAPLVMVRKRSWPAVSQICNLIHLLSSRIFLILKSILWEGKASLSMSFTDTVQHAHDSLCRYPIVVMKLEVKESSENRSRRQLLPTPEGELTVKAQRQRAQPVKAIASDTTHRCPQ